MIEQEKKKQLQEYIKTSAAGGLADFLNSIEVNTKCIPPGYNKLDEELDGGLYEGLYFIGGLPSLGKTSLALQMADQIAAQGQDVLIISLEMAKNELIAKSIRRETRKKALENKLPEGVAKTARGITSASRRRLYNETELKIISESIETYAEYASHIFIKEGVGNIGVEEVRKFIEKHINITGVKPVVVIDYLQIMAPYNERLTDKQNTDKVVMELKRISRDYKLPIIGISSLNRSNYENKISMQAFKESGAIEYSCDVLIGLQLTDAGETNADIDELMKENPRRITAVILKNRNGRTKGKIDFNFYTMFNFFKEA